MTFPDLAHLIEPDQDRIFGCLRQNLFYHLMPHLALLGKVNDFTGIAYWVNGLMIFSGLLIPSRKIQVLL